MQTYHRLKIDISRVSYRICRPYQEKIDDFYESGKIRFQWDMIRQAYLLSGEQDALLSRMTSDGIFTAAELIDMLTNPDKRRGYLYIGIQRSGGELQSRPREEPMPQVVLPRAAPAAEMPSLNSAVVVKEEDGFFVFRGRGWGHGVGLSQWGAMAMARDGWSAKRILEHYYSGTTVKRFR